MPVRLVVSITPNGIKGKSFKLFLAQNPSKCIINLVEQASQVILDDDVAKIQSSTEKSYLEAQKWAVSVPIQDTTKSWDKKTFKFYRVAPTTDVHYHPEIGAYDPKLNKSLQARYGHKS